MREVSIGEAILREVDDRAHAEYFAAARKVAVSYLGHTASDIMMADLRGELALLHEEWSNRAGRRLRKIKFKWIEPTNEITLEIEPFVPPPYLTRQS